MSSGEQPAQPPRRELVFCHQCREEWYRDEHGLVCPRCMGDFVEIVEEAADPRLAGAGHDMPDLLDLDSEDENPYARGRVPRLNILPGIQIGISTMQPPGHSGGVPQTPTPGAEISDMVVRLFSSLLGDRQRGQHQHQGQQGEGHTDGAGQGQPQADGQTTSTTGGPTYHEHRIQFAAGPTVTTRVVRIERNSNPLGHAAGGPPITPRTERGEAASVEELNQFLQSIMQDNNPTNDPIAELFARIFQHPPGANGDYVYSQTELDRVITELMEQHQGNAPPPAPKEVLEKLPKVKVEEQRVIDGEDCAVCKDELIIGEEVVQLPCKHVYHELCVKKWLEVHDTCPVCRRSTTTQEETEKKPEAPAPSGGSSDSRNGQASPNSLPIPGGWPGFLSAFGGSSRTNSSS